MTADAIMDPSHVSVMSDLCQSSQDLTSGVMGTVKDRPLAKHTLEKISDQPIRS